MIHPASLDFIFRAMESQRKGFTYLFRTGFATPENLPVIDWYIVGTGSYKGVNDIVPDREWSGIGGWYDTDTDTYYLDRITGWPNLSLARAMAGARGEKMVYNLRTGECIPVGGIE